ncbi:MAG TPA: helix-turn-helix domain-containing protein [Propionibacteriaceae bacterium]|nr:helix-turn-helix domain-containing protein [Propionibacteriaceae bacterium]
MSVGRSVRLGPTRAQVLEHLRTLDVPVPLEEIASAVGIHQNTARFHLDALAGAGLVVRDTEHREVPGRPKVLFRAAGLTRDTSYQNLAQVMVRHFAARLPDGPERALDAGTAWGQSLRAELDAENPDREPLERLVDGMASLGYEPELVGEPDPVLNLRPCPYGPLASEDPEIVCQMHLGLMRGVLGENQPWDVTAVEPWAQPTTCRVILRRRSVADESSVPRDA